MSGLFTIEDRDRVRKWLLERAHTDARILSGAEVGSLALGAGDRWSDLDLTFGVEGSVDEVLADWTRAFVREFDAAHLFDLPVDSTIYRVFLLPSSLQVDLSFAPQPDFGSTSDKFKLLFGEAIEKERFDPPDVRETFGWAVHDAIRARFCVERGQPWQAEALIGGLRNKALTLACVSRGLPAFYARGVDELPAELLRTVEETLVRSVDRDELLRALGAAVDVLLAEAGEAGELAAQVEPQLRGLTAR